MPEVGGYCVIAAMSRNQGIVLAYTTEPERSGDGGNWAASRPLLDPGDIVISTRDGNGVAVKAGGLVVIGANSMAQRLYLPVGGLVQDHFLRYRAESVAGNLIWDHGRVISGDPPADDGNSTSVIVRQRVRHSAQDTYFTVDIAYGRLDAQVLDSANDAYHTFGSESSGAASDLIGCMSVVVRSDEGVSLYKHQVAKSGEVFAVTQDLRVEVRGAAHVVVEDQGILEFGTGRIVADAETATLTADLRGAVLRVLEELAVTAGSVALSAGGSNVRLGPGGVHIESVGDVVVGSKAASDAVLVDRGLLAALAAHTHPLAGNAAGPSLQLAGVVASRAFHLKSS
jgi:hypothetical protein